MPTAPNDGRRRWLRAACFVRLRLAILSLGAAAICFSGAEARGETGAVVRAVQPPAARVKPSPTPTPTPAPTSTSTRPYEKKWGKLEGNAVWYDVPVNSLAFRRARKGELTAAHNRLPLGTMVRVTHLANNKSVIVRITDRGITSRRVLIDLCKEAAVQLDMLRQGRARVRLEILPDDRHTNAPAESSATKAHP